MTKRGDIIAGKYEVLQLLGEGGMAKVWLVSDRGWNKEWAIKEIIKRGRDENNLVVTQTLITEANLMKEFDHPMIPRVVDIIEDDDAIYVVMDRVQGRSLKDTMEDRGRAFDYKDVVKWGISLCDVLDYLHNFNPPVIYRDMKPDNIMLRDDNTVKLLDFGIARKYKDYKKADTIIGGTKGYAAPEQLLQGGGFSTVRSDVYGLGATLHHLVTGRAPYEDTFKRPIRQINPKLPEGLEYIIAKATSEDPDQRYQSCAEMRRDLERYERLTTEFRAGQEEKLKRFARLRALSIGCAALGILLLLLGAFFKNSTYESYIEQAATAETSEVNGHESEAEKLYASAIEVDPGAIDAYRGLIDCYRSNTTLDEDGNDRGASNFTKTEAARWAQIYNDNHGSIEGSGEYAQLCYDIGLLYLVYYENESTMESSERREYEISGGIQAAQWFDRAIQNYDSNDGSCSLSKSDRDAAEVYKTIGEFYDRLSRATFEGSEGSVYADYWDTLKKAVSIASDSSTSEVGAQDEEPTPTIVRLRLYQIVYDALGSPTYLNGFKRVGVDESQAVEAYHEVLDLFAYSGADARPAGVEEHAWQASKELYNAAQENSRTRDIYENIHEGRKDAANNIMSIYGDSTLFDEGRASQ